MVNDDLYVNYIKITLLSYHTDEPIATVASAMLPVRPCEGPVLYDIRAKVHRIAAKCIVQWVNVIFTMEVDLDPALSIPQLPNVSITRLARLDAGLHILQL